MNRNNSLLVKNKSSSLDYYRTPYFITREVREYLPNYWNYSILDPCSGSGDIIDIIKPGNYKVYGSDISTGTHFKDSIKKFNLKKPIIITNPPYKTIDEFLEFFFREENFSEVILFLPTEYISVKKRQQYYKYLRRLLIFNLRMNITKWRGGESVDFGAVTYAWFIFKKKIANGSDERQGKVVTKIINCLDRRYKKNEHRANN